MTESAIVATPSTQAVTERGATLRHTEAEVDLALRLLALSGGELTQTSKQLKAEGISITRQSLRKWRDVCFPRRYHMVRQELGRDVGEEMAGRAMERALQADEAQSRYIEEAIKKLDQVEPEHLAKKNALALAQAMGISVEKAQLLRDRPTEIKEVRSVDENIAILERLGVLKRTDEAINAQVVEEHAA